MHPKHCARQAVLSALAAGFPLAACSIAAGQFESLARVSGSHMEASTRYGNENHEYTSGPFQDFTAEVVDEPTCDLPIRGDGSASIRTTSKFGPTGVSWAVAGEVTANAEVQPCRAFEQTSVFFTDNITFSLPRTTLILVRGYIEFNGTDGPGGGTVRLYGDHGANYSSIFLYPNLHMFVLAFLLPGSYELDSNGDQNELTAKIGSHAWASMYGELSMIPITEASITPPVAELSGPRSVELSLLPAGLPSWPEPTTSPYAWQVRVAGGDWVNVGGPSSRTLFPGGGWASADRPFDNHIRITIVPDPGVTAYEVRCVISESNNSLASDPAELSICYANCDGSTTAPVLNVNDFLCFMTHFAVGDTLANCDGNTLPPFLDVNDFVCFQTQFVAGCP